MQSFQTNTANLRQFTVHADREQKRGSRVAIADRGEFEATPRFWNSILSRFGISDTVFKYFSHEEVFQRIADHEEDVELQYTVEYGKSWDNPKVLAVVAPDAVVVPASQCLDLFNRYQGDVVQYADGFLSARFLPSSGQRTAMIGPDDFRNRFVMEVPVDGWGKPRTYLEMLRIVCGNGAIAAAPAFRGIINMGNDPMFTLGRTLETFDNGEGFQILRSRFQLAQRSWASVREVQVLAQMIIRATRDDSGLLPERMRGLTKVTGDFSQIYGIVNLDVLSKKKQAVLPAKCTVYDLINFASELATHHADATEARIFQGYIGGVLSEEYDLESTVSEVPDFAQFLLSSGDIPAKDQIVALN